MEQKNSPEMEKKFWSKFKAAVINEFTKGSGARAINYTLIYIYIYIRNIYIGRFAGTGEKRVSKILQDSKAHQKINPKFRNKPDLWSQILFSKEYRLI